MPVITGLTLSHFRSHKLLRLTPDGRPLAIFGPNGAGKTNILEAVSLLSPGRGLRRAASDELSRKPEGLGWKIAATLEGAGGLQEVETGAEAGAARQVRIDGKSSTQVALGRVAAVLWLVPSMDRLWLEGAEGRRRFLDRMTLSFEPGHAEAVLDYEKAMRERNRLLKDQLSDEAWYRALEDRMAISGAIIEANREAALERIAVAQAGARTSFPIADLEVDAGLGQEGLRAAFAAGRRRDMQAGRTLIGPHRADLHATFAAKGMPARQCSTGEQKALLISVILANSRALNEDRGAPPLLLLDEVAAHLDAARRAALYEEITALKAQAWMTGTGIELFEDLRDRAALVKVTETGGVSDVEIC